MKYVIEIPISSLMMWVCSLLFLWLVLAVPGWGQMNTCKVTGNVNDVQRSVVTNAKVYFRTAKARLAATGISDIDGKFDVTLPKGAYRISVRSGVNLARPRRANIVVACDDDRPINLYLLPECVSYGCGKLSFDFAVFGSSWTKSRNKDLVIAYAKRARSKKRIIYKDALLTFDFYTIRADRIIQNTSSQTFLIKGPGWTDDGKHISDIAAVAVKFTKEGIQLGNRVGK